MGLFDSILGRKTSQPGLAARIAGYPPYVPPVLKKPASLTQAEAEANLAHLLQARPQRLATFASLLADFGIGMEAGLRDPSPEPLLDALWRWTLDQFPAIHDPKLLPGAARTGALAANPVFGLLTDLALVLGEITLHHRQDCGWALNIDPDDRSMPSYRQPCIIQPAGTGGSPALLHPAGLAFGAYANCRQGGYRFSNDLKRAVMDFISAGRQSQPPQPPPTVAAITSRQYDYAGDHYNQELQSDYPDEWAAAHLELFVAWLAKNDLLEEKLQRMAAPLKSEAADPHDWLQTHCDGRLWETDLTAAGNRFTRAYYGTPAGGLHTGPGSYLHDFTAALKNGEDTVLAEPSWQNYHRLAPALDLRFKTFLQKHAGQNPG